MTRIRWFLSQTGHVLASLVQHGASLANPAVAVAATVVTIAGAATGTTLVLHATTQPHDPHLPTPGSPAWHRTHPVVCPPLSVRPLSYLGVYEPISPTSYSGVQDFERTAGRPPNIALYYSGWREPFQTGFARDAFAAGAIPAVQMDPNDPHNQPSLSGVADGGYDSYLTSYADQVADYGHPVIIGFAHEPDGDWYRWGDKYVRPQVWVAAWQHVVDVFRRQGADNVTWMWTINVLHGQSQPLSVYWPGRSYVNWVGIDGYYTRSSNTFANVFGPTIASVALLAPRIPILLSETAVAPISTEPEKIADMDRGIRSYGNLGLIWFDASAPGRSYRLEGRAQAIQVFQRMVEPWQLVYGR